MMPNPVLNFQNVTLVKSGKILVKNINATLAEGEAVIISGPSGSGKTSLLRLVNRLDDPETGVILFKGKSLKSYVPAELRRQIAFVSQTPILFQGTVLENFHRIETVNGRPVQEQKVYEDNLRKVGLSPDILQQDALSLSLGEKQRFSVARALLNQPEVLLLDEPTSALDPESARLLLETIASLHRKEGLTILMVTHQDSHGKQLGGRFWRIQAGELVEVPLQSPQGVDI